MMRTGRGYIFGGLIIIIIFICYVVTMFNSLIKSRNKVKEKAAQIDVLLKRRIDLIPNIVDVVKGYAKHEKGTLESVIKARNTVLKASNNKEKLVANNKLDQGITSLFAIIENYPELNSNDNFMNLQEELRDTEDNIAISRQYYNSSVLKYKNKIEMFPSNLIANICGFKSDDFYSITSEERKNVEINFEK